MVLWLALIGCGGLIEPPLVVEDRTFVVEQLTGNFREGPIRLQPHGAAMESISATVTPVRFDLRPGFSVSAALWTPQKPTEVGIIVAHGHYGQGKSGAEAQEIAHRLAARGAHVLAVDTPGVEEWDQPGRHMHFSEGAHNRGWLLASGSSALALQVEILRRGLDVLSDQGARRFGATGASGGAVQAFYLAWLDERISAIALASVPRIPREAAAGGCACDQIPGHPGPDPSVLGSVRQPILWMSDVQQDRPKGLGSSVEFEVYDGPHSFTADMQRRTLDWFEQHLGIPDGSWLDTVPAHDLSTGSVGTQEAMPISSLPVQRKLEWAPAVKRGGAFAVECEGSGPVILALGSPKTAALKAGGFTVCRVGIPSPPGAVYDELAWARSIGHGDVRVDALAGAVLAAAETRKAEAVWGHRAWGLVAAATGLPFVVEDPISSMGQVNAETDPPWIHVPGAWEGSIEEMLSRALAVGKDPQALVVALAAHGD